MRLSCLREVMRARDLAAVVLVGMFPEKEGHITYFSGYRVWTPPWPTSSTLTGAGFSFALITSSEAELLVMRLDPSRDYRPFRTIASSDLIEAVGSRIDELKWSSCRIGLVGSDILPHPLSRRLPPSADVVDLDSDVYRWRAQKDKFERQVLGDGAAIAVRAIEAGRSSTRSGGSNRTIAAAIIGKAIELGADHVLRCRVRSGTETGLVTWPYASGRELHSGDFVQVDLVGIHRNYVFDVSRVWVAGTETSLQADAIHCAEQLTSSLIDKLRPGIPISTAAMHWRQANDLPTAYRAELDGHSIGIDVVEPPWIGPSELSCLQEGMVLCVEPSIIFGCGHVLKVEEMILVSEQGNVVLSTH